jgi:DMSO/TMAO reductase YedYZ heme-binding membrane subunit
VTPVELDPQFWWWLARATGLVAWGFVIAAIAWGVMLSGKAVRRRGVPAWLLDLHRYLGTLALLFVAVHLAALAADDYVQFSAADLFVPMASDWRPIAVALGIASLALLVVVQVSSWLMRHLPRRVWRGIHFSSIGVVAFGTMHGLLAGADSGSYAVQLGGLSALTVLAVLVVLRVVNRAEQGDAARVDRAEQLARARERLGA